MLKCLLAPCFVELFRCVEHCCTCCEFAPAFIGLTSPPKGAALVQAVQQELTEMLKAADADMSALTATVHMLRMLNVSPQAMRTSFLSGRCSDLTDALDAARQRIGVLSVRPPQLDADALPLAQFVKELSATFLPRLRQVWPLALWLSNSIPLGRLICMWPVLFAMFARLSSRHGMKREASSSLCS
jgi:hypothetical protein